MTVIEYLKSTETKEQIIKLIQNNLYLYQGINTKEKLDIFTGSLYNMFVKECVQNNQYISLSNKTIKLINKQYQALITELISVNIKNVNTKLPVVVENHRKRLIQIIESNEYSENIEQLIIPCFEYTNDFQEQILRINESVLQEPIIDVGCGINCSLVKLLKRKGYKEVFGIDQYLSEEPFIISSNWFDFIFQKETYGTIISHMAFTNHYRRAIACNDGKEYLYEEKYNEILGSLKSKGKFIYSPSLISVENKIDTKVYSIHRYRNTEDRELDTVIISRL
jgi:hypothetical protein